MAMVDEIKTDNINTRQYVTFVIGNVTYGIDVVRAKEVLNLMEYTKIPNAMPFMKGVIDLRGVIVPLIDMRIKFNIEEEYSDQDQVVIIIEIDGYTFGMIVDAVSDVTNLSSDEIYNTPHFSKDIDKDAIQGIGRVNGKLVVVMDVDKIFTDEEIHQINQID